MIVVNFKNYKKGADVVETVKLVNRKLGKKAIVCLSDLYLGEALYKTKANVFAQHCDFVGRNKERGTGFADASALKGLRVGGTLLNHSEHRLDFRVLKKTLEECGEKGLKVIVCVASLQEARKVLKLKPWAIAFEDPKLVGSGKSVTDYDAKDVKKFAAILKGSRVKAFCGAGISRGEDYRAAKKLGCSGVLVASAIANSSGKKLERVLDGFAKV